MPRSRRRICFVTGTRADFGLMEPVLRAIRSHPKLELQIIATGMHLSESHGNTLRAIRHKVWRVNQVVEWKDAPRAQSTGTAMSAIASALDELNSDIVLVVGDRVEAFAAASAGHISGRAVAHVHGGDRAAGQVDDSLRHAITKLAHIHFPATRRSAARIRKLGEDSWRIHRAGTPGIDEIRTLAAKRALLKREGVDATPRRFALLVLHPVDVDEMVEKQRALCVLDGVLHASVPSAVLIYPNNDPGSRGIIACWDDAQRQDAQRVTVRKNVSRELYLGLLRDAAMLVGNSSSGIIEAASFGTPVVDIGPRQRGRERSANVIHAQYTIVGVRGAVQKIWRKGRPARFTGNNVYDGGASKIIPRVLAGIDINDRLLRKLIAY